MLTGCWGENEVGWEGGSGRRRRRQGRPVRHLKSMARAWVGLGDSWHVLSREVTSASLRMGSPSFIGGLLFE